MRVSAFIMVCSSGENLSYQTYTFLRLAVDVAGRRRSSDVYLHRRFPSGRQDAINSAGSFDLIESGTEYSVSDADEWERCETDERGRAGEIRYMYSKTWRLGCVNSNAVARGSQDAGSRNLALTN